MAKLYPPHLEGTIPAFTKGTLIVPFSMNRAVGPIEVHNIVIKIKKVNSNEVILTKYATSFNAYSNCQAVFNLTQEEQKLFYIGQYYRIQMAYVDNTNTIGYFSTVGVTKYTALPRVEIVGLNTVSTNLHIYDYIGQYTQLEDPTEKLYSSRLQLLNSNNIVIEDSGEIIHNTLNDIVPNQALENFNLNQDLSTDEIYKLILTMTTINGLEVNSPKYKIIQRENNMGLQFDEVKNISLKAEVDYESGSSIITLVSKIENKEVMSGTFTLFRSPAELPYRWEKIQNFIIKAGKIANIKFNDYTIEQGKQYIYSIQQYNNYGIYSNRIISNMVYADFEDTFLLDGERQLKIRFNPKISSMKNTVMEAKTNTIGSKYPFVTRNGKVDYKEFSISGLISYQMDDNRTFTDWKTLKIDHNISDLTSDNIYAERIFKLEVLEWLNNGKPKILKSPVEGNYIVRLMNISLTPNDSVGRMLHNFNCSAFEIAEFNYDFLTKYEFIGLQEPNKTVTKWKTIYFSEKINDEYIFKTGELINFPVYSVKFYDMEPGSKFYLDNKEIHIGVTGSYSAKTSSPIYSLRLPDNAKYFGYVTVEYEEDLRTSFDDVTSIYLTEIPTRQIIGNAYWQLNKDDIIDSGNIISSMNNIKDLVIGVPIAKFKKRGVYKIYTPYTGEEITFLSKFYNNGYSLSEDSELNLADLDQLNLYEIHYSAVGCEKIDENGTIYYIKDGIKFLPYSEIYYDPQYKGVIEDSYDIFNIKINDEYINLEDTEERYIENFEFKNLVIGDGIIAELTIILQTMEYSYEQEHKVVSSYRKIYDRLYQNYQKNVISSTYDGNLEDDLLNIKKAYKQLIEVLEQAIKDDYMQGE